MVENYKKALDQGNEYYALLIDLFKVLIVFHMTL